MKFFKGILPLIVILIFSFFAFKSLLMPGFFPIHDDTQVARVFEMTKALKDGMFPVRWSEDLGYGFGYPIFNFYNPFPYYVGGFISLFGANALLSTKLMMLLGVILAGFSMYVLAKEFWGKWGGILASLFYIYAPYHAVDIYVRGDVAEFWAYALIPLLFYSLWKIYKEQKWKYVVLFSVSFALIIISHNLTAVMISPFLVAGVALGSFFPDKGRKLLTFFYSFLGILLGLLLSAFYSLPVILEMKYTNILSQIGGGANFRDHFVCPGQLWTSVWGYGGSVPGCNDGLSFMIGKYHIILSAFLFLLAIFLLLSGKFGNYFEKEKQKLIVIVISFIGFLTAIFFTLEISKPVWELISPMSFLQYPWRFLVVSAFFTSFISGAIIWVLGKFVSNKAGNFAISVILSIGIVLVSAKFFVPQVYLPKTSEDYTLNSVISWTTSKISDEYMPKNFRQPKNVTQIANFSNLNSKDLKVVEFTRKTQELSLDLLVYKDINLVLPLAYFPAWKGTLDGQSIPLTQNKSGILIALPEGRHSLKLAFVSTVPETVGNLLSLAGIVVLFIGIIQSRKKHE